MVAVAVAVVLLLLLLLLLLSKSKSWLISSRDFQGGGQNRAYFGMPYSDKVAVDLSAVKSPLGFCGWNPGCSNQNATSGGLWAPLEKKTSYRCNNLFWFRKTVREPSLFFGFFVCCNMTSDFWQPNKPTKRGVTHRWKKTTHLKAPLLIWRQCLGHVVDHAVPRSFFGEWWSLGIFSSVFTIENTTEKNNSKLASWPTKKI